MSVHVYNHPQGHDPADPLYYLYNLQTAVRWVLKWYSDLLDDNERSYLSQWLTLPTSQAGLVARLVMRRGDLFNPLRLEYAELWNDQSSCRDCLSALQDKRWIDLSPNLTATERLSQLTLAQIRERFADQLPRKLSRTDTLLHLLATLGDAPMTQDQWLKITQCETDATYPLRFLHQPLFDRVRLLFFGSLRQDWSDFVTTQLGFKRYENVNFDMTTRVFNQRAEVDTALDLYAFREQLDQSDGEPLDTEVLASKLQQQLQHEDSFSPWLRQRRDRVWYALAQVAEKQQQYTQAQSLYARCNNEEAAIRRLRLAERYTPTGSNTVLERLYAEAYSHMENTAGTGRQIAFRRIRERLARKLGHKVESQPRRILPHSTLELDQQPGVRVEQHVINALQTADTDVWHVENSLFLSLYGLTFWDAVFAPLPGAFFQPFQSAPRDLYEDAFVKRRQTLFDKGFASLQSADYPAMLMERFTEKQGIQNPFVFWQLDSELLQRTIAVLDRTTLAEIFMFINGDIKNRRSGLPDLILMNSNTIALKEVKGPGDRLQDNQRVWFKQLLELGIDCEIVHVKWRHTSV